MESDKLLRKKRRALLTHLRECCIFSMPISLVIDDSYFQITPHKVTELNLRDLEEEREIVFSVSNSIGNQFKNSRNASLLVDLGEDFFRIPLNNLIFTDQWNCTAKFKLENADLSNRRRKERKKEPVSYFAPIMLYAKDANSYPISGYARLVDSDEKALCLNLQFFQLIEESLFQDAEILFQENPLGIYERKQKIFKIRNHTKYQQADSYITKVDVILTISSNAQKPADVLAVVQPSKPTTVEFECVLHDKKKLRANLNELLIDGFYLELPSHEIGTLPSRFQIDHVGTGLRFNTLKVGDRLFVSYSGLSLGGKTVWFNFITHRALGYDHCFNASDAKKVVHLMFESGNYSSQAILQLSLINDYFQNKWPVEETYSPTKYRWLVRDRHSNYIGHTAGVRVSETLWAAIDNIGSQSYSGSWNAEFVARWIRSFKELLTHSNETSWIQWTFVPEAGVWTRFDDLIKSKEGLSLTRDRFWGLFILNRKRYLANPRSQFRATDLGNSLSKIHQYTDALSESQKNLLQLMSDGLENNSSFQIDFEREYGFRLTRYFQLIESPTQGRFLLTYANYPAWATLHKGHNWDYIFPLDPDCRIDASSETEFLDVIEEAIFKSGCTPYRLAIVSPTISLSSGVAWTNLSLHPDALEWAAKSLEKS